MGRIDDLDLKILSELARDASISVPSFQKGLMSMLLLFIAE